MLLQFKGARVAEVKHLKTPVAPPARAVLQVQAVHQVAVPPQVQEAHRVQEAPQVQEALPQVQEALVVALPLAQVAFQVLAKS